MPVIRGTYNVDNKLRHILDLVSSAKATKTTLSYTIRPDANWNWGGKKIPVTYKDFVYTWQAFVDPKNDVAGRDGYDQITGYTHKGDEADHVQVEEAVRSVAGHLRRHLPVAGARRTRLQQDLDELHLR